ncbi:MAG: hypothetical protein KAJ32_10010 [Gammaproteobacteria bacterium]|nr:hypothetical protein [Gammaproteobacteria bacterium]
MQLHPQVIYGLLFHCIWATLKAFTADSKRLGAWGGARLDHRKQQQSARKTQDKGTG